MSVLGGKNPTYPTYPTYPTLGAVGRLQVRLARQAVKPHVRKVGDRLVKVQGYVRTVREFGDGGQADAWGRAAWKPWADRQSPKGKEALLDYGATGYRWVNAILRGTQEAQRSEWNEGEGFEDVTQADIKRMYRQWVPDLDAAFADPGATTLEDVKAHRGAPVGAFEVGNEFTDPAFVSTSLVATEAQRFAGYVDEKAEIAESGEGYEQFKGAKGVTFEITVPAGTPAVYVDAIRAEPWEHELLLGRGLRYRVMSIDPPRMEVIGRG